MAGLQSLLEDYRNWNKTQDWKLQKQREEMFGGDYQLAEDIEKWGGGFNPSNIGQGLAGFAGAIKAYHGSPHAFERFDFSKMGTGEGSQAFGHGGYFAQAPETARQYANMAKRAGSRQAGYAGGGADQATLDSLIHMNATQFANKDVNALADLIKRKPEAFRYPEEMLNRISEYVDNKPPDYMYEVSLEWPNAAKEAATPLSEQHLLDWDMPYENQPSSIQELLKQYYSDVVNKRTDIREGLKAKFAAQGKVAPIREEMSPVTGQQLYDQIASQLNSRELASNYLSQQGIPGIRYLDQASRGMGEGTRNYVIFDENIPRIVSRNNVSLTDLLRK